MNKKRITSIITSKAGPWSYTCALYISHKVETQHLLNEFGGGGAKKRETEKTRLIHRPGFMILFVSPVFTIIS